MSNPQLLGAVVAIVGVLLVMAKPLLGFVSQVKIPSFPSAKSKVDCRPDLYASLFHIRDHLADCPECVKALDEVIAPKIAAVKPGGHDA